MPAYVYVLRLRSGSLYTGVTEDLDRCLKEHFRGGGCSTTRLDPPVKLEFEEPFESRREAERRERQIKHWTRIKKEALIAGEFPRPMRSTQRSSRVCSAAHRYATLRLQH